MRVVVISDLHIGSGPLDDFDREIELGLVAFCREICVNGEPTEFVINGDFLDFVQAEPWHSKDFESQTTSGIPLCFTEEQSLEKLKGIFAAHPETFDALGQMLRSPVLRQLTILPGNHDADFFWNRVQEATCVRIAGDDLRAAAKVKFHFGPQYHPEGFPDLWIEHGHQYDPCNSFEFKSETYWSERIPPILADRSGVPRLLECVGTRFLLKFMNDIDAKYPFVDNVKPFSKCFKMFFVSSVAPGYGPLKAGLSTWALGRFMAGRLKAPMDILSSGESARPLAEEMKRHIKELTDSRADRLTSRLAREGFNMGGMPVRFFIDHKDENLEALLDFLSENPDILDEVETGGAGLLSAGHKGYLSLVTSYLSDETADLKCASKDIIARGLATGVVMGHTHEPVTPDDALAYVNTGSWTRYYVEKSGGAVAKSWNLLKASAIEHFHTSLPTPSGAAGPEKSSRARFFDLDVTDIYSLHLKSWQEGVSNAA
jgi:UDP-2,3-diacylglucosamine pyrophosphatase LpxH